MRRAVLSILFVLPLFAVALLPGRRLDPEPNGLERALEFFVNGDEKGGAEKRMFKGWGPYSAVIIDVRRCIVIWGDTGGIYLSFVYDEGEDDWRLTGMGSWRGREDPDALRDMILLWLRATTPPPFDPRSVI